MEKSFWFALVGVIAMSAGFALLGGQKASGQVMGQAPYNSSSAEPWATAIQKQLWLDNGTGLLVRELSGVCVYELTSKQNYGYGVALQVIPKTQLLDGASCW